jgi:hypothetical protein
VITVQFVKRSFHSEFAARKNGDQFVTPRPQTIVRRPACELAAFSVDFEIAELRVHEGSSLSERLD